MHKIGIIGGGQLGKMMILDAKRLDDYFVILDPTPHSRLTALQRTYCSQILMMWQPLRTGLEGGCGDV